MVVTNSPELQEQLHHHLVSYYEEEVNVMNSTFAYRCTNIFLVIY